MLLRLFLTLLFCFSLPQASLAVAYCDAPTTSLEELVKNPKKYKNKKIFIEGDFHSFSTLALDYKPALRASKNYVGIVLSRPDHKQIPLVELKIAAAIKDFKDDDELANVEHGDKVRMEAKVYAVALGEAWLDARKITVEEKINKEEDE